jgi:hypothetical protein
MGLTDELCGFGRKYSNGVGMGISNGIKGKGFILLMGMVCPP